MSSPTESSRSKFRRNYRACLNCRLRKVKCDLGSVDNPIEGKCARCKRERKDCVFVESKRGGKANVLNSQRGKVEKGLNQQLPSLSNMLLQKDVYYDSPSAYRDDNSQYPPTDESISRSVHSHDVLNTPPLHAQLVQMRPISSSSSQPNHERDTPKDEGHFSTMEGALVYLAKAAGTIAKADERDNIDAGKRHEQLENDMNQNSNNKEVHYKKLLSEDTSNQTKIPKHIQDLSNYLSIPITNEFSIRPRGSNKLSNIDYIGENGLLTEYEAEMLVNLFFTTMHPYFPHIPSFLHKPQVLAGYPILLCAILTISSRYHSLDDNPNNITTGNVDGVPRNIEIHDKLWLYVQRLISQTVWAEASTRSIGTIFAFLLLTEWNPRAIHWRWSDYANRPEDNKLTSDYDTGEDGHGLNGEQHLAGLGAMRRSYRMAWMLIGSSVRLAQDMGFMEVSSKTFLATHISEINSVMNISRRSMLSHSLSEVEIDDDYVEEEDTDNDHLLLNMTEEEIKEKSAEPIRFSFRQRAKIELLQIMSLSHESLYGHKAQLGSLSQRQNLAVLNIISPLISNWERKYKTLLRPTNYRNYNLSNTNQLLDQNSKLTLDLHDCIEYESNIFEFNYAKLYVFSLALSSTPKTEMDSRTRKKKRVNLKLDEISKSAKYIEEAFFAANEMLAVAHRVHKLKMLRFMPVRWVTRIVRAVAFIVKCYLTITAHKNLTSKETLLYNNSLDSYDATILSLSLIPVDEIMSSIQKAAITLRDCSPDELHLCTRYSNVLMYLCSEMKTNSKGFNESQNQYAKPDSNLLRSYAAYQNILTSNSGSSRVSANISQETSDLESAVNQEPQDEPVKNNPNINLYEENVTLESATPLQNLIGDSEVMEWFINNKNIGLDFVGPWTEMIEQQLNSNDHFNFDDALL